MKNSALILIVGLLVGCVPKSEFEEMSRLMTETEDSNRTLRARVSDVENENAELRAQLAKQADCGVP
jgi:hypothetical protein